MFRRDGDYFTKWQVYNRHYRYLLLRWNSILKHSFHEILCFLRFKREYIISNWGLGVKPVVTFCWILASAMYRPLDRAWRADTRRWHGKTKAQRILFNQGQWRHHKRPSESTWALLLDRAVHKHWGLIPSILYTRGVKKSFTGQTSNFENLRRTARHFKRERG
jgi:hypothetical protein